MGAVGLAEIKLQSFAAALATPRRALTEVRTRQVALFEEPTLLAYLAWAHKGLGESDAAVRTADEAVEGARRQGTRVVECLALLTRVQVRRVTGGDSELVLADIMPLSPW